MSPQLSFLFKDFSTCKTLEETKQFAGLEFGKPGVSEWPGRFQPPVPW